MTQKIYLQLVGAESYGSPLVGNLKRGESIELTDVALATKLLRKGSLNDDQSHKPLFRQVDKATAYAPPALENQGGDLRLPDLNPNLFSTDEPATTAAKVEPVKSTETKSEEVKDEEEEEEQEEEEETKDEESKEETKADAPAAASRSRTRK